MSDARFNPDGLVLSGDYRGTMDGVVLPFLAARREEKMLAGDGDRPIYCARYDAARPVGTALIVHGFTENADKFAELIYSLLQNGWSVCAYDHRGHGRSWRDPALDDISLTHVDRFEEYVRDMEIIYENVVSAMPGPRVLFAHSMGGAVSALFAERHPGAFAKVALCAPMIAPNLAGLPVPAAELMCAGAKALGKEKKRIFASKPYAGPEDFATSCATGRERFDWYDAVKAANPAFHNNGPTYGWTREAIRASKLVLAPGEVEKIDAPVRVYTAEDDNQVMPDAQQAFAERLRDGRRALVKGAKHEIYRSGDDVLFPWWHEILDFFGA